MRIAILSYCYWPNEFGGGERSTRILAHALKARGHEIRVFSVAPDVASVGMADDGVVPVFRAPLDNVYYYPAVSPGIARKAVWHLLNQSLGCGYRQLVRALTEFGPDVVHLSQFTGFAPALIGSVRTRLRCPIIYTGRDYGLVDMRTTCFRNGRIEIGSFRQRLLTVRKRRAARFIDHFAFNSARTKAIHESVLPFVAARSSVIYTDPPQGTPVEKVFTLKPHYQALLIGKLSPEKGTVVLLRALQRWPSLPITVKIAGDGPELDQVKAICRMDNRFEYVGVVDGEKKDALFRSSDFLLQPSVWEEPFPRVILEAFYYSVAVVATPHGGNRELIGSNGDRGYLFSFHDIDTLLGALSVAVPRLDELNGVLARARDFVVNRQQYSGAVEYENLYRSLVAKVCPA